MTKLPCFLSNTIISNKLRKLQQHCIMSYPLKVAFPFSEMKTHNHLPSWSCFQDIWTLRMVIFMCIQMTNIQRQYMVFDPIRGRLFLVSHGSYIQWFHLFFIIYFWEILETLRGYGKQGYSSYWSRRIEAAKLIASQLLQ